MPVLLSLFLPTWATDLVRRRWRLDSHCAIILSRVDHQREVVDRCCFAAMKSGVAPGMTIAHAKALLPPEQTHVEPLNAGAALASLRRLAAWMIRLVPVVAVDPPDGLWLDATGCERLYGRVDRLIGRITQAVRPLRISASVAAAPTWGAAWALARFSDAGQSTIITDVSRLRETLSPLPVAALRLDDATIDRLHRIGLRRIGHLLDLPRSSLADRYGESLLLRLDQALGQAMEVIQPIRPSAPVMAERLFDGPTDRLESIEEAAREVINQIAGLLESREAGTRALRITLCRSDLEPLVLWVRTARPTRDPRHLWKLLHPKLESAHLGFGVEGIIGHAQSLARLRHDQQSWACQAAGPHRDELGRLIDTLAARLGPQRVMRALPVESHQPERAMLLETGFDLERPSICSGLMVDADRPSRLLRRPVPVQAMFLVPDGPIARLTIGGEALRVRACIGPERIEPEWWRSRGLSIPDARDYFKVHMENGRWLWVYREVGNNCWRLHGEWA